MSPTNNNNNNNNNNNIIAQEYNDVKHHINESIPLLKNTTSTSTRTTSSCYDSSFKNDTNDPQLGNTYNNNKSTIYKHLFFTWLNPLLELGNTRPLEADDLYSLNPENRANQVYDQFVYYWKKEGCYYSKKENNEKNNKKNSIIHPSIISCLMKASGLPFLYAGLLKVIHDSLIFVSPMVIQGVIGYLNDPSSDLKQYFYYCYLTGMRLRSACVTAIYQKSLRLSTAARQRSSAGEISNLMSVDAQHLQDLPPFLHAIWYAVYQVTIAIYLLYQQMGPSCLAGVAVIFITIPLTGFITRVMKRLQRQLLKVKDERMKICYEVLSGIKVIKLQAWEDSYRDRVMLFRDRELNRLKKFLLTRAAFSTLSNTLPSIVGAVVFATYILVGHNSLDVSTALTSLSLFNILRNPLFMLPTALNNMIQAYVSLMRMKKFLLEEECETIKEGYLEDVGVVFKNAHFSYQSSPSDGSTDSNTTALRNVSIEMKHEGLYAIVGKVGSGKSTLLHGLLGDAKCIHGEVYRRGSIAFISQQSFILNATLRDNILFGQPYDKIRYNHAIYVSALESDLKMLPGGDNTEIGEKGINLSGGQRARVSIARAVYSNADIYLFDDPLAAVDGHVGRHIFDECIVKQLKGKLRILVTNAVTYLSQCDQILVLEKGHVVQCGTYFDLLKEKHGIMYDMVRSVSDTALSSYADTSNDDSEEEDLITQEKKHVIPGRSSILSRHSASGTKLITVEDRATGDVPFSIYKVWFNNAFGIYLLSPFLFLYILIRCFDIASTFWLLFWSENATTGNEVTLYLSGYVLLQILNIFGVYLKFIFLYLCGLKASRKLFVDVMERILHAPMCFFDTTPLGRIVNRLSKDVSTLDEQIPFTFDIFIRALLATFFTLATIIYVTPLFVIFLIPICIMYYMSQRYYIKTSRELQRLDNISRSPVHALLTETLDGMATIRAYKVETLFIRHNNYLLDANQRAYFLKFSIDCWLALRLEFAGTMIATGATLFAVLQHGSDSTTLFAGLAGVSMSYAFSVTQTLNFMVKMISQLQTQMVSVERIKTYADMDVENNVLPSSPHFNWRPSDGGIEFDNLNLRYRPILPLVLKNVSFLIHPREKIGIVGRTGGGKSSLIVSIMRLVESASGCIRIDGVDISQVPLHELRYHISVIPQDPVLFSGTIRTNVDPFRLYTDSDILASLNRAHLHNKITSLDQKVSEGGANFSIGERQLICIARALLRKSKIILLDEATASIDVKTDSLIQESIKNEFSDCTCLTIAHRINTIMDSDRVLVMDAGRVADLDTVDNLLKSKGIFAGLVNEWRKGAASNG